ncbi:ANR family transcriptional regulator [Candidatus Williamhamiltonella defendens]|uniref:ANR family transcriptional regulator n=1 Tax=Candidatus Williamhamiltonella defendens TaxID=138072 RepID=UPI0015842DEA|nr:ANR family transcriptional regulator [Candidatus Hamiltonella defensa]
MAFRKNDSPLYFKAAQDFTLNNPVNTMKPRAWSQANRLARNRNNRIWSENRADFCLMQIKRENIKRIYPCG